MNCFLSVIIVSTACGLGIKNGAGIRKGCSGILPKTKLSGSGNTIGYSMGIGSGT